MKNPSQTTKTQATTTATSALKVGNLKTDPNNSDSFSALMQSYATGMSLVGSVKGDKGAKTSGLEFESIVSAATDTGCAQVSDKTITYNNCSYGGTAINGTIKISGDTITIDLVIKSNADGQPVDMTYTGSITVTDQTVDGSLDVAYKTSASGYTSSVTVSIDYNSIQIASGCPVGGSLDVNYSVNVSGVPAGSIPNAGGAVTIKFGPNCGDMKVYG